MSLLGFEPTPEDAVRQMAVQSKANTIFIFSLVSILFCCIGGIAASIVASRANDAAAGKSRQRRKSDQYCNDIDDTFLCVRGGQYI